MHSIRHILLSTNARSTVKPNLIMLGIKKEVKTISSILSYGLLYSARDQVQIIVQIRIYLLVSRKLSDIYRQYSSRIRSST